MRALLSFAKISAAASSSVVVQESVGVRVVSLGVVRRLSTRRCIIFGPTVWQVMLSSGVQRVMNFEAKSWACVLRVRMRVRVRRVCFMVWGLFVGGGGVGLDCGEALGYHVECVCHLVVGCVDVGIGFFIGVVVVVGGGVGWA